MRRYQLQDIAYIPTKVTYMTQNRVKWQNNQTGELCLV
jgi:hypothetical protein